MLLEIQVKDYWIEEKKIMFSSRDKEEVKTTVPALVTGDDTLFALDICEQCDLLGTY